jgi:hypothetical protein
MCGSVPKEDSGPALTGISPTNAGAMVVKIIQQNVSANSAHGKMRWI